MRGSACFFSLDCDFYNVISVISEISFLPAIIDVVGIEQRLKVELVENASTDTPGRMKSRSFLSTLVSKEIGSSVDTRNGVLHVTWLFLPTRAALSLFSGFRHERRRDGDRRGGNAEQQPGDAFHSIDHSRLFVREIEISQLARIVLQENPSAVTLSREVFDAAVLRTVNALAGRKRSHSYPIVELGSQSLARRLTSFDLKLKAASLVRFPVRPWEESEQDKTLLVGIKCNKRRIKYRQRFRVFDLIEHRTENDPAEISR